VDLRVCKWMPLVFRLFPWPGLEYAETRSKLRFIIPFGFSTEEHGFAAEQPAHPVALSRTTPSVISALAALCQPDGQPVSHSGPGRSPGLGRTDWPDSRYR